jgi:flagellar basal body-associated protein FliL
MDLIIVGLIVVGVVGAVWFSYDSTKDGPPSTEETTNVDVEVEDTETITIDVEQEEVDDYTPTQEELESARRLAVLNDDSMLNDMSKEQLELLGREFGVELDRRRKLENMIKQLKEALSD